MRKIKEHYVKTSLTKYDVTLNVNKRNSLGQHVISCEESFVGSFAPDSKYPRVRGYMECSSSSAKIT